MAALLALSPSGKATEEAQTAAALHETTLFSFTAATGAPTTGLVAGPSGVFYGATAKSIYTLYQDATKKWQVKTLYAFTGATASFTTISNLIVSDGIVYGSSLFGGASTCTQYETRGCGFVFSLTPTKTVPTKWVEKTIYRLTGGNSAAEPVGLVSPKIGTLYGLSEAGGGAAACGSSNGNPAGCGTAFQMTLTKGVWAAKILYRFTGGKDGGLPMAPLSLDAAGKMYYSAYLGGATANSVLNPRISPNGSAQGCGNIGLIVGSAFAGIVEEFPCDSAEGDYPDSTPFANAANPIPKLQNSSALTDSSASANYVLATAQGGGNVSECVNLGNNGCGTVFLLSQPVNNAFPWKNRTLHRFVGPDGSLPNGALLEDGSSIYGVASAGGINCASQASLGCGVIYALTRTATGFAYAGTAYKFGGAKDGATPRGQLALLHGQIFATTQAGGANRNGTIVMLAP